ncbi:MAG: phosphoribosyltransferase [Cyanobacteriota bacterium]|nr:phosphoribosyltransferase [Cyanobacteriota bacterium]
MKKQFTNRTAAGRLLATQLMEYADAPNVLVLGLPRGGVPVAYEIAATLKAPLDIWLARKLGVPGNKELAMGAIGWGESRVLNQGLIDSLQISDSAIAQAIAREKGELARRDRLYRGSRPQPNVRDCTIILVDDGIATGSTLSVAIASLRSRDPAAIIVAAPVIPPSAREQLLAGVDKVVSLIEPDPFHFLGFWYDDFSATSDAEVCDLLARSPHSLFSQTRISLK